jgi:hypothetical protein
MNTHDRLLRSLTRRAVPLGALITVIGLTGLFGICRNNPYLAMVFAILILFVVLFLALALYRLNLHSTRQGHHLRRRLRLLRGESALFHQLMARNLPEDPPSR